MRHAGIEMVLVEQRTEAGRRRIEQLLMMIEHARHRRRTAVAMQIDRADQEFGDLAGRDSSREQRYLG